MQFEQKVLAGAVARIMPFISARSALPVLRGVKITPADGKQVTLEGTDQWDIGAIVVCPAIDAGDTSVVVNAADLKRAVTGFKYGGKVTLATSDVLVTMTDGKRTVGIETYPLNDYPVLTHDDDQVTELVGANLADVIPRLAVAASHDQARPMLTTICLDPRPDESGTIDLVATDTYRLAAYTHGIYGPTKQVLWPARGAVRAVQLTGANVAIHVGTMRTWFGGDGCLAWVRHVEGAFPKWRSLMPSGGFNTTWTFGRQDPALTGLASLDKKLIEHIPVRIGLAENDDEEVFVIHNAETIYKAVTPGTVVGDALKVAYNARYLAEGLAILSGPTTKMQAIDALKPAIFSGDDDLSYLLMPVRI